MPYLRITCPEMEPERRYAIAQALTDFLAQLFWQPRAGLSVQQLRERTTIHFVPYREGELFIAGQAPAPGTDLTVELSDWNMPVRQQRRIARELTPMLMRLFQIPTDRLEGVNIRFHPYPPTDFAVGGKLLADRIPWIGRWMKRMASR